MVTVVIPSRFHSSRFPGKPLALVAGTPLVLRVAAAVRAAGVAGRVIGATDDARIAAVLDRAGVEAWVSGDLFRTGSDRVAAAIAALDPDGDGPVLNVQGDEVGVDRRALVGALAALEGNDLGTVATRLGDEAGDRDAVKVVVDGEGRARSFARGELPGLSHLHLGIYSFTRAALARFAALPTTRGEREHDLEQLRALEHGLSIGVRVIDGPCRRAINRPEDVARVEALLATRRGVNVQEKAEADIG
jgi:3-deoxy-manno-octulosonate cytidylyltransferase (CMP-KDO synthetase)